MSFRLTKWLLLLAVLGLAVVLTGCATDEPDNASVRPWNSPQGWENGLSGMQPQRH